MGTIWGLVEGAPEAASALSWRQRAGAAFAGVAALALRTTDRIAATVPCPEVCGCGHRVVPVRYGGSGFVGVCNCEEECCEDLVLGPEEVAVWELDLRKLGRAVARALECEGRDGDLGLRRTWQVGAFGGPQMPVVLSLPMEAVEFRSTVGQLIGQLREHFILLTPTGRFMDATCHGMLKAARAGFFDLESNVTITPAGTLQARWRAGELFSRHLPAAPEPASEDEARRLFALLKELDSGRTKEKAPLARLFTLLVLEGRSQEFAARELGCSPGTVSLRVRELERKVGRSLEALRALCAHGGGIRSEVEDHRARTIYRKGLAQEHEQEE